MIELLLGVGFGVAVGWSIIVAQIVILARIFRSRAWIILALACTVIGGRIMWGFIQLPAGMIRAIAAGRLPDGLNLEQWILLSTAFLAIGLFIVGFDQLRRDLKAIGV